MFDVLLQNLKYLTSGFLRVVNIKMAVLWVVEVSGLVEVYKSIIK